MTKGFHDRQLSERVQSFIQRYCTHVRGSHTGQPFLLASWQKELVTTLFSTLSGDGRRQYKIVWLEAPRKSGKTTLAAALMLYMLLVDEEAGAEIVISSSSSSNAAVCFNIARSMVENDVSMSAVCCIRSRAISYKNNSIRLVSGPARALGGMNLSMAVVDDVQNVLQKDYHETLRCCMAARRSPIILYLASAGYDKSALGWELHRYARSVMDSEIEDRTWLVRIHAAEAEDDWTDPKVWKKSHPGLGLTISEAFIREECIRALRAPGNVDAFRRSFLNVWTEDSQRWLDMEKWDSCQRAINWDQYAGRRCRIGLDLSATTDLTAVVVAFGEADGGYALLPFAFCPEEAVDRRSRRDGVDYRQWVDRGFLTATSGNAVDYLSVQEKILNLCNRYDVVEVLYDKWCASMLVGELLDRGLACLPVKQDSGSMTAAIRELEQVVEDRRLRHDGHPILRWCASNTCIKANSAGEIKPAKHRSRDRIDVAVASMFALWLIPLSQGDLNMVPCQG
ncbi:MAG: terminase large subunit [Nitrospira sp.]